MNKSAIAFALALVILALLAATGTFNRLFQPRTISVSAHAIQLHRYVHDEYVEAMVYVDEGSEGQRTEVRFGEWGTNLVSITLIKDGKECEIKVERTLDKGRNYLENIPEDLSTLHPAQYYVLEDGKAGNELRERAAKIVRDFEAQERETAIIR